MKKGMKLSIALSTLILSSGFAQKSMSEINDWTADNLKKKTIRIRDFGKPSKNGKGMGLAADLSKKEIKTIALVSFSTYAEDFSYSSYRSYVTESVTSEGTGSIINVLYNQSVNVIESTFENEGYEFVTIDEFSEDQKKELEAFKPKKLLGWNKENAEVPEGYKKLPNAIQDGDYKFNESMGELADQLGVDAVCVVENVITLGRKKSLHLSSVYMRLYGKNPIPKKEGERYPGWSYNSGMCYTHIHTYKKFEAVQFGSIDKKSDKIILDQIDGYENLMKIITQLTIKDINQRKNK